MTKPAKECVEQEQGLWQKALGPLPLVQSLNSRAVLAARIPEAFQGLVSSYFSNSVQALT